MENEYPNLQTQNVGIVTLGLSRPMHRIKSEEMKKMKPELRSSS
jgi:hypothetical protein